MGHGIGGSSPRRLKNINWNDLNAAVRLKRQHFPSSRRMSKWRSSAGFVWRIPSLQAFSTKFYSAKSSLCKRETHVAISVSPPASRWRLGFAFWRSTLRLMQLTKALICQSGQLRFAFTISRPSRLNSKIYQRLRASRSSTFSFKKQLKQMDLEELSNRGIARLKKRKKARGHVRRGRRKDSLNFPKVLELARPERKYHVQVILAGGYKGVWGAPHSMWKQDRRS